MSAAEVKARRACRVGRILQEQKPRTWAQLEMSVTLEEVLLMAEVLALTDVTAGKGSSRS